MLQVLFELDEGVIKGPSMDLGCHPAIKLVVIWLSLSFNKATDHETVQRRRGDGRRIWGREGTEVEDDFITDKTIFSCLSYVRPQPIIDLQKDALIVAPLPFF
ncbi:hypothetical protein V9T40_008202 [Parthenolecanium corni]|uniref:Uncharacterized protein n=1 Tax=Parthenolecanium corni TaxID=536013 RepID=A0AAN9Y792_9HEMI